MPVLASDSSWRPTYAEFPRLLVGMWAGTIRHSFSKGIAGSPELSSSDEGFDSRDDGAYAVTTRVFLLAST